MTPEQEQISRDFKLTFETSYGLRTLKRLETICFGFPQAPIFSRNSARETDFNLGMNWVYGYIKNQIELTLDTNEVKDCQTEQETKTER